MKQICKMVGALIVAICMCFALAACGANGNKLANIDAKEVSKLQVISSMGNPDYGADSKIITDEDELKCFIATFNSGKIGKKVSSDDLLIGFTSRYVFYNDGEIIAEYYFNANNTKIVAVGDNYHYVEYGDTVDSPYKLYENSKSAEIVVDLDGKEMDLIRYNDATYVKSTLSEENLKWLEHYNSLTKEEQSALSYSPDLGEPFDGK